MKRAVGKFVRFLNMHTLSTELSTSKSRGSISVVSPIHPMIVISVPRTMCVSSPRFLTIFSTRVIVSSVECGFSTIIIKMPPCIMKNILGSEGKNKSVQLHTAKF